MLIPQLVGAGLQKAAQVGSSIFGAIKSSQAYNKARDLIQNQRDENQKWYDQTMAEDYTKRTDSQNVLRKQRELLDETTKRLRATNVVAGGTDEALALQKASVNDAVGDTFADMAANASSYKEGVENQFLATDAALNQQIAQGYVDQAKAIAEASGQVGKSVSPDIAQDNLKKVEA